MRATVCRVAVGVMWTVLWVPSMVGCDADTEPVPELVEGVYAMESRQLYGAGCDGGGSSVRDLSADGYFVVARDESGAALEVVAGPCGSPQACREIAELGLAADFFGMSVFEPSDGSSSRYRSVRVDHSSAWDNCDAVVEVETLTVPDDGRVRLERRVYTGVQFPLGVDEYDDEVCLLDEDVLDSPGSHGGSCRALEVIEASGP